VKTDKIEFIQALRGVAALLVVMEHAQDYLPTPSRDPFVNTGAFGVDLFFIISGFIMVMTTRHLRGGLTDALQFMLKRICRIVPLYVIAAAAFVLVTAGAGYFADGTNLLHFVRAMVFFPVGPMTARQPHGFLPLLPGWTLNYEMLFYVIFAASMLFRRWRWVAIVAAFFILLVGVPWVTRGTVDFSSYGAYHYYHLYPNIATNPILWLFLLGMAAAFVKAPAWIGYDKLVALSVLFWSIALWQCFSSQPLFQGPSFWAFVLFGGFVTLLLINGIRPIQSPKPLIIVGNISYSLYLTHKVMFAVTDRIMDFSGMSVFKAGFPYIFLLASVSVVAAYIFHGLIETRLSNAIQGYLVPRKTAARPSDVTRSTI